MSDWSSDVCSSDLATSARATCPISSSLAAEGMVAGSRSAERALAICSSGRTTVLDMMRRPHKALNTAATESASDRKSNPRMRSDDSAISLRARSEEHTSELQSLMRISYAVFCLKKKTHNNSHTQYPQQINKTTKHINQITQHHQT